MAHFGAGDSPRAESDEEDDDNKSADEEGDSPAADADFAATASLDGLAALTEQQLRTVREAFANFDTAGSGYILRTGD
jgi:hypothetical protein